MSAQDDAIGMAAGTFGCLVFLTVAGVTPLLVLAGHGLGGTAGALTVVGVLVCLPLVVGATVRFLPHRDQES